MTLFGRPLLFTPQKLAAKVEEYFVLCDTDLITIDTTKGKISRQKPYTISGLCIHLGISRETWSVYSDRQEYQEICSLAKLRCENALEVGALAGVFNPIMAIFSLKNNYQWTDRIDVGLNKPPEQLNPQDIRQILAERRERLASGSNE